MQFEKPFYHFSIDDVIDSLIEVTDRGIDLWEHPFFRFLNSLHKEYETNVDLYLFYQKEINGNLRMLTEVTEAHRKLFQAAPWLRFGPHALDYDHAPYQQTPHDQKKTFDSIYNEIDRFAGSGSRSSLVRLHYFSESYELAEYFHTKGVKALFSTDREAVSHRMDKAAIAALTQKGIVEYQGVTFIRSHGRIEYFEEQEKSEQMFARLLSSPGFCVFFTHEIEFPEPKHQEDIRHLARYFKQKGIPSL